jgi:hypothetical protein
MSEQARLAIAIALLFALRRRIEAVRDQVQKCSCNLLREYVDLAGGRIQGSLQRDVKSLLLRSRWAYSRSGAASDSDNLC